MLGLGIRMNCPSASVLNVLKRHHLIKFDSDVIHCVNIKNNIVHA